MRIAHALPFLALLLLLAACDQPTNSTAAAADPAATTGAPRGAKIGYVNADSVLSNYAYLAEQTKILQQRESDATASLERKNRKLQESAASFQRRAQGGNMTPKAIENESAALQRQDQELQQEFQRLQQEFQGETLRLQSELATAIKREVESVQAEQGYDYIISYGSGSPVLAVNPDFELTAEVIARMNAAGPGALGDSIVVE